MKANMKTFLYILFLILLICAIVYGALVLVCYFKDKKWTPEPWKCF